MSKSTAKTPRAVIADLAMALPSRQSDEQTGQRIAMRRKELGLTQKDIAGPNYTGAYISRIEAGERTPPVHLLLWLGLVLNINPTYLAWGRGNLELGARQSRFALLFLGVEEKSLDLAYVRQRELQKTRRPM